MSEITDLLARADRATGPERAEIIFTFLMESPDSELKRQLLFELAKTRDHRAFKVAQYVADPANSLNVKRAIVAMLRLSPAELEVCKRLTGRY